MLYFSHSLHLKTKVNVEIMNTIQNGGVENWSSVCLTVIVGKVNESSSLKYAAMFYVLV